MPTIGTTPDVTNVIDQRFFLRPLGGPEHPQNYLDRFPESVYNKGIDSHLVKFMYALLGMSGVAGLRKNYLEARLKLEDFGLDTFDLDKFYGDPIAFGRILEEVYDEDPRGILSPENWEKLRARDAQYRNRALTYVSGVRAGGTPLGMRLVAKSGLGHEVEIIENYKYIYDQLTDDTLGIQKYGATSSTEEMVIVPRRELPQNEIQTLTITGTPTAGTFTILSPMGNEATNTTTAIPYAVTAQDIEIRLQALPTIGRGNVRVTGGPLPDLPVEITFTGALAHRDVPKLQIAASTLTGSPTPTITLTETRNGVSSIDEVVDIGPRDKRYLQEALSRIKPVTAIVTYKGGQTLRTTQAWSSVQASSVLFEVVRYVTGQQTVPWPNRGGNYWIEGSVEHQAPRAKDDEQHTYHGFHNLAAITAYTEDTVLHTSYLTALNDALVVPNVHIGQFNSFQQSLYPALKHTLPDDFAFTTDQAPADYAEPLTITATTTNETPTQLINGIYPVEYRDLPNVPRLKYPTDQFWASQERGGGEDYLEIDLGAVRPINYLYFEATKKPFTIDLDYDILDQGPERSWTPVTWNPSAKSVTRLDYDAAGNNPWQAVELWCDTRQGRIIWSRYLRLKFTRQEGISNPFRNADGTLYPHSIEVRNLRVGRNVG